VSATTPYASVWDDVVGQGDAVARLVRAAESPVHAYLFVGPAGSTKKEAARAFAALLLGGTDDPGSRDAELVRRGEHPDVREVVRAGAAISFDQAREIVRTAALAPNEGDRKVMILDEFHLLRPEGAALLLKTIEEPPPSTTFVILADYVPHDLITISSRCARIEFRAVDESTIAQRLTVEGVEPGAAAAAAAAAGGSVERARVLAADPDLVARRQAFAAVAYELDGNGATVMRLVDDLLAQIESAAEPLAARHAAEADELDERIARYGERGSGRKTLEERHKRELRRHRTDELLAGLTVIAGTYRDALVAGSIARPAAIATAVSRIHRAIESFERNPNESLLLQSLLWELPVLPGDSGR
jgi:DNA polymerase III subunit delta'